MEARRSVLTHASEVDNTSKHIATANTPIFGGLKAVRPIQRPLSSAAGTSRAARMIAHSRSRTSTAMRASTGMRAQSNMKKQSSRGTKLDATTAAESNRQLTMFSSTVMSDSHRPPPTDQHELQRTKTFYKD